METTDRQNQDDKQKALDMTVQYVENGLERFFNAFG